MTPSVKAVFADNYYVDRYLPDLISCKISTSYYIPADIAYVSFYCPKYIDQIKEIEIEYMGKTIFVGAVDIQDQKFCSDGYILSLTARSLEGRLLDCEAVPRSYYYPSDSVIYENHLKYFGIKGYDVPGGYAVPELIIDTSTSEWEVIKRYFSSSHGKIPYVDTDRILRLRSIATDVSRYISNHIESSDAIHYKSVQIKSNTSHLISHIHIINSDTGQVVSTQTDSDIEALGIYRARYREYDPEDISAAQNRYRTVFNEQMSDTLIYNFEIEDGSGITLGDALDYNEPEHEMTIQLIVIHREFTFDKNGIGWKIGCIPKENCY